MLEFTPLQKSGLALKDHKILCGFLCDHQGGVILLPPDLLQENRTPESCLQPVIAFKPYAVWKIICFAEGRVQVLCTPPHLFPTIPIVMLTASLQHCESHTWGGGCLHYCALVIMHWGTVLSVQGGSWALGGEGSNHFHARWVLITTTVILPAPVALHVN